MKYLKLIDFGAQSLLMASGLVSLAIALFSPGWILLIFYIQLILGPWQVISALIWLATNKLRGRIIKYLAAVGAYFVIGFAWHFLFDEPNIHRILIAIYGVVLPWLLAVYYYRLRWIDFFGSVHYSGKFLRHLQF